MRELKTIVLMCTFNGEKYLKEQLNSLKLQTLRPDIVYIFDDKSTDETINIIENFIRDNELAESWFLKQNDVNKGWRLNFYDAIQSVLGEGDLVFFCDQDDIWTENKIEVMAGAMTKNPQIGVLSGKYFLVDGEGSRIHQPLKNACDETYNFRIRKVRFNQGASHLAWGQRIGCATCARIDILDKLRYFNFVKLFAHDTWTSDIGIAFDVHYEINFPAIYYRIHNCNSSGIKQGYENQPRRKEIRLATLKHAKICLDYFLGGLENLKEARKYKKFKKLERFLGKRIRFLQSKRNKFILCFMYIRLLPYVQWWRHAAGDIYYVLFMK